MLNNFEDLLNSDVDAECQLAQDKFQLFSLASLTGSETPGALVHLRTRAEQAFAALTETELEHLRDACNAILSQRSSQQ